MEVRISQTQMAIQFKQGNVSCLWKYTRRRFIFYIVVWIKRTQPIKILLMKYCLKYILALGRESVGEDLRGKWQI